jgi:cytoskeletal protein RodZ
MKCSECGHENKDKAKFCSKCGANLKQEVVSEPTSNNSKIIIAALVVVIVILALCIGYFALNNNAQTAQPQPQQQSSGSVQSNDSSSNGESSQQTTTTASKAKQWELIGTYSGSGSGRQSVNVPAGQIMVKLSAYPIKNYATNHLYVTGSNGESAGVDWGSTSAVETRSNSLSYTSSSPETFTIDYYETVSWQVEFYRYQ